MRSYITVHGMLAGYPALFENLQLPEGVDASVVTANIVLECGDLEVLYPNPIFMSQAIHAWSQARLETWERLYATLGYEYNPIENYNRHEEYTEPVTVRTDTGSGTDTVEEYVAGFNSSDTTANTPHSKQLTKPGAIYTSKIASATDGAMTSTGHIHGNIGVMSTQDMIKQEREISEFNIYDYIVSDFKQRFTILVY